MGIHCCLCDEFLPIFQLSHLCPICYEIRTIIKCYDNLKILNSLQDNFKIKMEEDEPTRRKSLGDSTYINPNNKDIQMELMKDLKNNLKNKKKS